MGMPLFSTDCDYTKTSDTAPNPNKFRFTIMDYYYNNGFTLLKVNYPDCTTFNGLKIILINGRFNPDVDELDPHFLEDSDIIARFKPTKQGFDMAWRLISAIETPTD